MSLVTTWFFIVRLLYSQGPADDQVGKEVPVLISLFANKMISCLEFICEESHRNLAVTSEQGNVFRVIRMES